MEFIKEKSIPKSTTTSAPSVKLRIVRPAATLSIKHTPIEIEEKKKAYDAIIDQLFDFAYKYNNILKRQDLVIAIQLLIENKIPKSEFYSRLGESFTKVLPVNLKNCLESNIPKLRELLYRNESSLPVIKASQAPTVLQSANLKIMAPTITPRDNATHAHLIKVLPIASGILQQRFERPLAHIREPPIGSSSAIRPKIINRLSSKTMIKNSKIPKTGKTTLYKKGSGALDIDNLAFFKDKIDKEFMKGTEHIGNQDLHIKETPLLNLANVVKRQKLKGNNIIFTKDSLVMMSQALEEHLKNKIESLGLVVDLRMNQLFDETNYKADDLSAQIQFIADVERAQEKKRKDLEREEFLRIAKSRAKPLDSENAKIRAKVKEMQAAEKEALCHRKANITALEAIAPRKKEQFITNVAKTDKIITRPCIRRANIKDAIFLLERDDYYKKSTFLYLLYLK